MSNAVVQALQKATKGLAFPSESEYPLEVLFWKGDGEDLDQGKLLKQVGKAEAQVKVEVLDTFFKNVVEEKDWQSDEEKGDARRFCMLVETLKKNLTDLKVFRVGAIERVKHLPTLVIGGEQHPIHSWRRRTLRMAHKRETRQNYGSRRDAVTEKSHGSISYLDEVGSE